MITFAVEGGFAGQSRSLQIASDGAAQAEVGTRQLSGEVEPSRFEDIAASLESSGLFASLNRSSGGAMSLTPSQPLNGADRQRYEIGYGGETVVVYDGAVPAELEPAVQLLQDTLLEVQLASAQSAS